MPQLNWDSLTMAAVLMTLQMMAFIRGTLSGLKQRGDTLWGKMVINNWSQSLTSSILSRCQIDADSTTATNEGLDSMPSAVDLSMLASPICCGSNALAQGSRTEPTGQFSRVVSGGMFKVSLMFMCDQAKYLSNNLHRLIASLKVTNIPLKPHLTSSSLRTLIQPQTLSTWPSPSKNFI